MPATAIALQRLYQQRLSCNPLATPGEIVAWLGAVQAQDYLGAQWALGLRMQNTTDDVIEQAFTDGTILRTHIMRPTWHFVAPADIRWMLQLTAPRVNAVNASMYRQLELDDALFVRSNTVIAKALQGGQQLTRAELGAVLAEAGIAAEGMRLGYIVGQTYWFSASMPPTPESSQAAFLLPTYDEFLVGFASFDESRRGGRDASEKVVFNSAIVIGGQVVGSWRRTFKKGAVVIELASFAPLTAAEGEAVTAAAQRYGEFLEMPVVLL